MYAGGEQRLTKFLIAFVHDYFFFGLDFQLQWDQRAQQTDKVPWVPRVPALRPPTFL